ncbi:MAG TPA: methyltransferase, partial [Allosphingosinicella sp.]|nr:methyltransferase [Allosphingosinicella sp.]
DAGALRAAIGAATRTPANVGRDRHRHPLETLTFFGVEPDDTVVEIWPGGGWYTEILAPYVLQGGGTYYAAAMGSGQSAGVRRLMEANPRVYGRINLAAFPAFLPEETRVPDGSADVVLTFRNVHNWQMGYQRDGRPYSEEAFRQMFAMLRPGGTLGVVDHRLPESADAERERSSGYIKVSTVRRLAEAAGFRLVRASEINANPRDTADWPRGVWTLPPTFRLGDQDRARYAAIGESDRMTLRFVKPE